MENWKRARDAHTKLYRELCADQQIYTVSMTVNDDDYGGGGGGGINDCMESAMARQKKTTQKINVHRALTIVCVFATNGNS